MLLISYIYMSFWHFSFNQSLSSFHLLCFWGSYFWHLRSPTINFREWFSIFPRRSGTSLLIFLPHSFMAHFSHYLSFTSHAIIHPWDPHLEMSAVRILLLLKRLQPTHRSGASLAGSTRHLYYITDGTLSVFSRLFSLNPEIITMAKNYWDITMCQACAKLSRYPFWSSQHPYRITTSIPPF